ncbi:DUF1501 domain-containing protein [Niveibacterium umoris]|uniref:Uncharacterized protein (DUF1501 family) n=1 Tax=Niveibacterium umoris TaxID=1193620 RepID=A0A840BGT3_9RHOO|nr:DUF1501 domain-containing protein [Niveibacterium umoris]MBB4012190.1 uncharacterized protein (DUF1501 family) [Niveibacterium umoris]
MQSRREFLLRSALAASAPWMSLSLAAPLWAASSATRRFVFVILRGGMDGLAAAPVIGDPAFASVRGVLAEGDAPLPLTGPYALHPKLVNLQQRFREGELALVHAVASPYRERSHFDAQQVLESGGVRPHELDSGWLGRALTLQGSRGLALASVTPLALRGARDVDSWSPSQLPTPEPDLLARIERLYAADPQLAQAFGRARALQGEGGMAEMDAAGGKRDNFVTLARAAGEFLARPNGPRVAVLEFSGWDTHANQAAAQGPLARNLGQLDQGLEALRTASGAGWRDTAVLVVSEFGRAVAPNGTRGTDHGTAGVAFVLGGAVAGGKVLGDWPGLASRDLHEGRDLRPTTDLRAVAMGLLMPQLGLGLSQARSVFPGGEALRPLEGLLRV